MSDSQKPARKKTPKKSMSDLITEREQEKIRSEQKFRDVAKLPPPSSPTTYEQWSSAIRKAFPDLAGAAETAMSVVAQLLIHDISNCFALILVDVPSAGKTITINMLDGIRDVTYSSDNFTPASFVSNAPNIKKEKLPEVDLLPRLRNKVLLCRDFAPIFSAREDDMQKLLGILTRVLDGEGYSTDTGVHGQREYKGAFLFMLIGASTPLQPRVWKAMGSLGPRMFFLRLHSKDKSENELAAQLRDRSYKQKERDCRAITQEFIRTLWSAYEKGIHWQTENDPEEYLVMIARCAKLLARLRGHVFVTTPLGEDESDIRHSVPVIEKPDRINQCLYNLARGHAVVRGRTNISMDDIPTVLQVTLDSAPQHRSPIIYELIRKGGELWTKDVQTFLNCSNPTALKEMETLCILGICKPVKDGLEKSIQLKDDLQWFLSEECRRLLPAHVVSSEIREPQSPHDAAPMS